MLFPSRRQMVLLLVALIVVFGGLLITGRAARAGAGTEQPTNVIAIADPGILTVTVSWAHSGSGVQEWDVEYHKRGSTGPDLMVSLSGQSLALRSYPVMGLQSGQTYEFRVCADYVNESVQNSVCSDENGVGYAEATPNGPSAQATPDHSTPIVDSNDAQLTSISIHFSTADGDFYDSFEVAYRVQPDPTASNAGWAREKSETSGSSGSHAVHGLLAGTTYQFQVAGCEDKVRGAITTSAFGRTCYDWSQTYTAATTGRVGDEWRTKWSMLDNNPTTKSIVAGDRLFQRWSGGQIWEYTGSGAACQAQAGSPSSCPGWTLLDNNSATVQIADGGGHLYQRWSGGQIWEYTGSGAACQAQAGSSSSCPGWTLLDQNPATADIVAGDHLFQRWSSGQIWEYTGSGAACQPSTPCPGWTLLDNNPATVQIADGGGHLFQRWSGGQVWEYTGSGAACQAQAGSSSSCPGWTLLDQNPQTADIVAGDRLFQRWSSGQIWEYTGSGAACQPSTPCPGWTLLDNNPATVQIADGGGHLYQRWSGGQVWEYTGSGAACQAQAGGSSSCPGWTPLDDDSGTVQIAAGDNGFYQLHSDGSVYIHSN